ncbi:MAG: 2Fe-2S iron-sulfur cluster binding domain-containing protein [Colwellia sp.]|nr:2Fe-2S iron-sulfur cluster binding domain-containing protein [Colwellia sp.]
MTNALKNNEAATTPSNKKLTIYFEKWHKTYQSNKLKNQPKTVLENGEEAGLILPYSCRAGMCGRCKAKLISGEVNQSSSDGLTIQEQQDGYILCCSAIATSDVVIRHD